MSDWIEQQQALCDAATRGDWSFAVAPADGSSETKAEYMAGALTEAGPLYAVFVPETVGDPAGYVIPAITGDGPNAANNAAFVAAARTSLPKALAALRAIEDGLNDGSLRLSGHSGVSITGLRAILATLDEDGTA